MNAEPPPRGQPGLMARARQWSERAGAALFGTPPGPDTSQPVPADTDTLLPPGLLRRRLSRRSRARAVARLSRLPCFTEADYIALHPDVAGARMGAAGHALFAGANEGRAVFRPERLARTLGAFAHLSGPAPPDMPDARLREPVAVYVSSLGNVFMQDIAADLVAGFAAAGIAADLRDETSSLAARPRQCLYVAPHEFFLLGEGRTWIRDEVIAGGVMLNTEQPQTPWFARALAFLLASRGVVDLCPQLAALFAAAGLPAIHVCPTPAQQDTRAASRVHHHPLFRVLPAAAQATPDPAARFCERPLDIAFFGAGSAHRDAWLARNAAFLSDYDTFLYARRGVRGTIRAGSSDGDLSALASHVCGHARVLLNLHRDEFGYFEWHRVVRLGMANGAVVVSEPNPPHPDLLPDVHYFAASARQIPDLLEWLLRSPDGQRQAQEMQERAAFALATNAAPAVARLHAFLHGAAAAP